MKGSKERYLLWHGHIICQKNAHLLWHGHIICQKNAYLLWHGHTICQKRTLITRIRVSNVFERNVSREKSEKKFGFGF